MSTWQATAKLLHVDVQIHVSFRHTNWRYAKTSMSGNTRRVPVVVIVAAIFGAATGVASAITQTVRCTNLT